MADSAMVSAYFFAQKIEDFHPRFLMGIFKHPLLDICKATKIISDLINSYFKNFYSIITVGVFKSNFYSIAFSFFKIYPA